MKTTSIFLGLVLALAFMVGCAGNYGKISAGSGEDRAASYQTLKDNLDDYDIYQCPWIVVLDPKNDDKSIEVSNANCRPVDREEATYFNKKKWTPTVKELLGPENEFYGYILIYSRQKVSAGAAVVAQNTMRVYINYTFTGRL